MDRRTLLSRAGVGVAVASGLGATGCLVPRRGGLSGSIRPETDPERVPDALRCEEEAATRVASWSPAGTVRWGNTQTFALRVERLSYSYGDTSRVTLTNTSSGGASTGPRDRHNLQRYTAAGWQDVRVWEDGRSLPAPGYAVSHSPNDGFSWDLVLTEAGVVGASGFARDDVDVCPPLGTGRYRFVFWPSGETGLAVAFDLRRDPTAVDTYRRTATEGSR